MTYDGFSPYDYLAEYRAAQAASTLRERRVGGLPVDEDSLPDEGEL